MNFDPGQRENTHSSDFGCQGTQGADRWVRRPGCRLLCKGRSLLAKPGAAEAPLGT